MQTEEGIWSVEFSSAFGWSGTGTIYLIEGLLLGGDDAFSYAGEYWRDADSVYGELHVTQHQPNATSIWGQLPQAKVSFRATWEGGWMIGSIKVPHTSLAGTAKLKRLGNLPSRNVNANIR